MGYPGGKASDGVYQKIINQIPPHEIYIEPYLGGGAILLHKRLAARSIGIDLDASVIKKWTEDGSEIKGDAFEVIYINDDAISFLENYKWRGGEFVYCDPPYLMTTRRSKRPIYGCEFATEEQHEKLLRVLLSLSCMVAISGYWSSLYEKILQGWRSISFLTGTRGGTVAKEWLWMNYPEPTRLHDYRYLGENFREREKYNRQRKRWRERLLRMSALQRYALLASIAELGE